MSRVTTDESCPDCSELLEVETEAVQGETCGCWPPCPGCGWTSTIVISLDGEEAWING